MARANGEPMSADSQILVVEDEATIRLIWERFLNRWGYQVDMAENGQVGLDRAREHAYRLIITDLAMPVLGGQELVRTLKAEQPDLEIIVTTGQGTIEIAVEMMKAGVSDFITKPINFGSAEYVIKKCLENVQAKRENIRLRRINRDLEELNKIKEKFIAITSHELRTPVSIIGNIVQALEPSMDGTEEASLFRMIGSASEQLREIVTEMHEISALNSEKISLQPSRFAFQPLCEEVDVEFQLVIEERGHRLNWYVPEHLSIRVDRAKIKKVLRELIQNAIKFTNDGGEITVRAANNENGEFELTVTDTGIGIPHDERKWIFGLFYEVSDTLHHHSSKSQFGGGGMGIGLAIVNDIVAAHQGRVTVDSEVGRGSRFRVTIPQPGPGSGA